MAVLQARAHLISTTRRALDFMEKDVRALQGDQSTTSPGGAARTAIDVVRECGRINAFIANYLATGETKRATDDEKAALEARLSDTEAALTYLRETAEQLVSVFDTLDESTLGDETSDVFGFPMTRFSIAELPSSHMMYHDGQVAYIQTLHGDTAMHWW